MYSFPLFDAEFCAMLLAELEHFQVVAEEIGVVVHRPNSMNKYGVILKQLGLAPIIDELIELVLGPLARGWFSGPVSQLDGHHSFLVQYEAAVSGDTHLDMHTDDADVTFNVCLGKEFEGAGLTFCGVIGTPGYVYASLLFSFDVRESHS